MEIEGECREEVESKMDLATKQCCVVFYMKNNVVRGYNFSTTQHRMVSAVTPKWLS